MGRGRAATGTRPPARARRVDAPRPARLRRAPRRARWRARRRRRGHDPPGAALRQQARGGASGGRDRRAAGGERLEETGAQGEIGLEPGAVRRDEQVDVAQEIESALGGDPVERGDAGGERRPHFELALDLAEAPLRRRLGIRVADEEEARRGIEAFERGECSPGVVPVVEPAEEQSPLSRGRLGQQPAMLGQGVGEAEGHGGNQLLERRIVRHRLGVDASERGQEAEVVEALLGRGAEEEIAARELMHPGGVVVAVRIEPERVEIVQVLDQPGIVEVDRDRQVGPLDQQVVGELPLGDRDVPVGRRACERSRSDPTDAIGRDAAAGRLLRRSGREQDDVEPGRRQPPGDLEVADADPPHGGADRLARQERDPLHRPRIRCHQRCVRQARVPSIVRISVLSRSISP